MQPLRISTLGSGLGKDLVDTFSSKRVCLRLKLRNTSGSKILITRPWPDMIRAATVRWGYVACMKEIGVSAMFLMAGMRATTVTVHRELSSRLVASSAPWSWMKTRPSTWVRRTLRTFRGPRTKAKFFGITSADNSSLVGLDDYVGLLLCVSQTTLARTVGCIKRIHAENRLVDNQPPPIVGTSVGKFVRGEYVDNFVSFSRRQEDSLRLVSAASAALESGVTLDWDFADDSAFLVLGFVGVSTLASAS